jgi:thiol-disulfide isomerase/thioredoxin
LIKQLQSIYKQLQLPENEFNTLKEKSNLLTKQKISAAIKAKFGTAKANDFVLKNLSGQYVSLSSFKNKVIVIDFWATWCVPCRASFPAMQDLVNKYKNDSSVVFLFIDVWENKSPQKMQETAMKLMTEGNYSFNVLLDTKDEVVDNFRVDAIPAKFIIDKAGEIVFMGETSNIALEIEKAKN